MAERRTAFQRGWDDADGDAFYTAGQSVSRSPNPYDSEPEAREWSRGYAARRNNETRSPDDQQ